MCNAFNFVYSYRYSRSKNRQKIAAVEHADEDDKKIQQVESNFRIPEKRSFDGFPLVEGAVDIEETRLKLFMYVRHRNYLIFHFNSHLLYFNEVEEVTSIKVGVERLAAIVDASGKNYRSEV